MGTVKCEFGPRDEKVFGKPWVGKLYIGADGKGKIDFIDGLSFQGTVKDGGTLLVQAEAGDVLKFGQKNKAEGKSKTAIAIVKDDYELEFVEWKEAMSYLKHLNTPASQMPKKEDDWELVGQVKVKSGILMMADPLVINQNVDKVVLEDGLQAAMKMQTKLEEGFGNMKDESGFEEVINFAAVPETQIAKGFANIKACYDKERTRIRKLLIDFES